MVILQRHKEGIGGQPVVGKGLKVAKGLPVFWGGLILKALSSKAEQGEFLANDSLEINAIAILKRESCQICFR